MTASRGAAPDLVMPGETTHPATEREARSAKDDTSRALPGSFASLRMTESARGGDFDVRGRPRESVGYRHRGFNLVETLVAGMILSGAVLTLGALSTNALTDVRLNRHYEVAAALIERQLTFIDYLGVDEFVEAGQTEGVFEEFEPGYQWRVSTEYQGTDNLYLVTIAMHWLERTRPHSLTIQTMLNGTGAILDTGTGATQTQEQQTQR